MVKKKAKHIRHVPQRTCVGCGDVLSKRELVRLVRTGEGIRIDPSGKVEGRGAYLHADRSCWEKGLKGALARALKIEINEIERQKLEKYVDSLPAENVQKLTE